MSALEAPSLIVPVPWAILIGRAQESHTRTPLLLKARPQVQGTPAGVRAQCSQFGIGDFLTLWSHKWILGQAEHRQVGVAVEIKAGPFQHEINTWNLDCQDHNHKC
eukprot:CAMPEP_0114565682 /NCGR_PEP_ID=MMETSP0114-20121206/14449_1 /TAXON_ID=31324 /ORGANISM="Goniomonas sp, Strain m" /LENGTH=105 /DNA_ID=CAMNT_0001751963 /DNA_START=155 /DNA_END=472 /DNA_ORIENTATION=-